MSIKHPLFILFFFTSELLVAQGIDNDSTHHYLIMRSKSPAHHSHIFRENKRLTLQHCNGKSFTGRLYFINDSTVQLINVIKLKADTFTLNDITKVRNSTLLAGAIGYSTMAASSVLLLGGALMIADGNVYGDETETAIGVALSISGIFYALLGKSMIKGKRLHLHQYDLKQHTAKGYQLKRKHLKYLFPRKTYY